MLCPDTGRNYLSKMYDDAWLAQNGFTDVAPEKTTAGDLLTALGREGKLIYLLPDNTLQEAIEIFRKNGISQLPVFENGQMAGAVQEITIMRALRQQGAPATVPLRGIMARPMPQVDSRVPLEEVYRLLLAGNTAVVVNRDGHLAGLITRSDLVEYYAQSPAAEDR